jgi:hypothetical protein
MQDAGCRIQDAGCRILIVDAECWMNIYVKISVIKLFADGLLNMQKIENGYLYKCRTF